MARKQQTGGPGLALSSPACAVCWSELCPAQLLGCPSLAQVHDAEVQESTTDGHVLLGKAGMSVLSSLLLAMSGQMSASVPLLLV